MMHPSRKAPIMIAAITNLAVVQLIKNPLLNIKFSSAFLLDKYEDEVRALPIDATTVAISVARVKQVIGARFKSLQRLKQHLFTYDFGVDHKNGKSNGSTNT